MEGWDGTTTGGVTEDMRRRWQRFGLSGAKLIWGGEAMAVRPDGRANPNQLILNEDNAPGIAGLRETLIKAHEARYGRVDDLVIGFQLTHSGRFCRPNDKSRIEPRVAYRHPILDSKFQVSRDDQVLSDDEIKELIDAYIRAAVLAWKIGAQFVDIKHCHGYLLHEFLSARSRPGEFGGSFDNRTRLLRDIVAGIRSEAPGLQIGVRLSAFDFVPFKPDPAQETNGKLGPGIPEDYSGCLPYDYGFGVNQGNPVEYDLGETKQLLQLMDKLGIHLVNLSAGSPYYNPHIQRPAIFPPTDGYQPCEDPLVGVSRQIQAAAELKSACPNMVFVGSAYSYLQEYLPHVAEYNIAHGLIDVVGLGRVVLSYPDILVDAVEKGTLERKKICRTFSDCTTAPRNGMKSGCYPLDDYYRTMDEAVKVKAIKMEKL
jgi:2,4-dienoyl-CoA reductase-like NADH-dependent reductase (Old Yellow Enzyme family)